MTAIDIVKRKDTEKRKDTQVLDSVVVVIAVVVADGIEGFAGSDLLVVNKPVHSIISLDKPVAVLAVEAVLTGALAVAVEELEMNCLSLSADL
jgi:hypothetical protein